MEKTLDLRIIKTYKALHESFTELLDTKSFEELTVNELCDKAMIRRATFYKHFEDKYEYFDFYLSELREEFQNNISAKTDITNPADYSLLMLHETFQFVKGHQYVLNRLKDSNRMSFLYQAFEKQISLELYHIFVNIAGNPPTPESELIIAFYAGGIINIIFWWINNPGEMDEDTLSEKLITLFPLPITKIPS